MQNDPSNIQMRKSLGLLGGVSVIMGIMFGTGIFVTPKEILYSAGSVYGALCVWAICGGMATLGALCYAELGTVLTGSGGDYHYIYESYGPLPSFLFLWDAVMVIVPTTNAVMALTLAENMLKPLYQDCPVDVMAVKLLAACSICLFSFINAYSIKFTTRVQTVCIATFVICLAVIIVGGFYWMFSVGTENFHDGWKGTKATASDWAVAFYAGLFAYSGWGFLNFMTEELENPSKNLPRAIFISLPLVSILYLLANVSFFAVLGPDKVLKTDAIAVDFAEKALGWLKYLMMFPVTLSVAGSLCVHIMTTSRICFAAGRNGHMIALLTHINIKCMSPLPSLVFLMVMSLIMLIPNNLTTLITYCSLVESFFNAVCCSAVLWLRYKKPNVTRPIKVKLWMPVTFVATCVGSLLVPIVREPMAVLGALLMTLTGVPVYYLTVCQSPLWLYRLKLHFSGIITRFCQKLFLTVYEEVEEY